MSPEEIKEEIGELMAERGYSQEAAVQRLARAAGIDEDEVRESLAGE